MEIRHASAAEMRSCIDVTGALAEDDVVGRVEAARLQEEVVAGRVRPEWTWLAHDAGRVVARAVWWGRAESRRPLTLDCLRVRADVDDRAGLAAELLARGHAAFDVRPDYELVLRPGGRVGDATVGEAVEWRSRAARAAGLCDVVERPRYEWLAPARVPAPSEGLIFRPGSDVEFLAAFERVAVDSLDVRTRRDLAVMDPQTQARGELEFYRSCPGDRAWWRLAETADGELVGLAIPSATPYHRNVGYLGVVPERRGRSHVDDLLAEITRVHVADGAERITATTDATNVPMAAGFDRAGYLITETRMVFSAPTNRT